MRFNKLLMFFVIYGLFFSGLGAESVSGQYTMPVKSVKFEKCENYSILPVGWSKKGNAAFLLFNREPWTDQSTSGVKLIIINTVEDQVLWLSPLFEVGDSAGIASLWNENSLLFSEKLSQNGIIPQENAQYGGTAFTLLNDDYKVFSEESRLTGVNGLASVSLKIESKKRGSKLLYKFVQSPESKNILVNFKVLGFFKSPWENRLAVAYVEDTLNVNGEDSVLLKFSGAHLTIGFRRVENNDTKLIDAVMSGQYYNSMNLLKNGADPKTTLVTGEHLLILAARQFNWDIVFLLVQYGADINQIDKFSRNLMHYAVLNGNLSIVERLQILGVDTNLVDSSGYTSLALAEKKGLSQIQNILKN